MSAFIRKEIRLLLPAWLAAAVSTLFAACFLGVGSFYVPFGFGLVLVALSSFGRELGPGTFSLLLAQPVSRARVWFIKAGLLAVALLSLFMILCLSLFLNRVGDRAMHFAGAGLIVLAAFSGGLWTTLLLRQVSGAFWFTVFIPALLLMLFFKEGDSLGNCFWIVGPYSVAGILLSFWLFLRAQDVPWTGGTLALPGRWRRATRSSRIRSGRPLRALFIKELQFQQGNIFPVAFLVLLNSVIIAVRVARHDEFSETWRGLIEISWCLWMFLPVIIGGLAVAEERKLGTFESQLSLPVSRRLQFTFKFLIALGFGLLMGGVMPWLSDLVGGAFGLRRSALLWGGTTPSIVWGFLVVWALTTAAFYASTLTRNLIQALGATLIVSTVLIPLGNVALHTESFFRGFLWSPLLISIIAPPVLWVAMVWLAFANFKRQEVGWSVWRRNLLALAAVLVLVSTSTAALYHRVWELFQAREPMHGAAQLTGPVTPKICAAWHKDFVLLPDGRVWGKSFATRWHGDDFMGIRPGPGGFIGTNRWIDLAASIIRVVGVQSDGSLWSLYTVRTSTNWVGISELKRIGTDSDWKSVAAGSGYFMAIKTNGTLWGCGSGFAALLDAGPAKTNDVIQFGHDSDWKSVVMWQSRAIGIKQDGSVWKWGDLRDDPDRPDQEENHLYPNLFATPVRSKIPDTNILVYHAHYGKDVIVRSDRTLWAYGGRGSLYFSDPALAGKTNYVRLYTVPDVRDAMVSWDFQNALKNDGSLWKQERMGNHAQDWDPTPRKMSQYRDWIAMEPDVFSNFLTLAADGTICCWQQFSNYRRPYELLGPSRKPVWSANVLAEDTVEK